MSLEVAKSEKICLLDGGYMRLGHFSALLSLNGERCVAAYITDLLKRALFAGELDPPPFS